MNITMTPAAEAFLLASHEHGRVLPQELAEQLPYADGCVITVEPLIIGGYEVPCMTFQLSKEGEDDLTAIIGVDQVMSRHPQSREPLFRGKALIDSVLIPLMRAKWSVQP